MEIDALIRIRGPGINWRHLRMQPDLTLMCKDIRVPILLFEAKKHGTPQQTDRKKALIMAKLSLLRLKLLLERSSL